MKIDPDHRLGCLIKFFAEQTHADAFRSGQIRLGQVASFRAKFEDDLAKRHDPAEFADIYSELVGVTVYLGGTNVEIGRGSGRVHARRDLDHQSYIFCATAVTAEHLAKSNMHHRPDSKLAAFGPHAIIVTNYREFVSRVYKAVCQTDRFTSHPDLNGSWIGLVEYVDFKTHLGTLGPLRKSVEYEFQDEWRMVLIDRLADKNSPDHFLLNVGDLSDITMEVNTEYLLRVGIQGRETAD